MPLLKPAALGLIAASVLTLSLSACAVSNDTRDNGREVICATADSMISSLKAGGAAARVTGALVRDNTKDPKVKDIATKVAANNSDAASREKLSEWIKDKCRG